jgi:type I restriction enzyme, S subunit
VNGTVDSRHINRITEPKFEQLRSGKIREGDLLYCLRGSPGRIARVSRLRAGAIASSLVIIRPTKNTNKEYLFYTLSGALGSRMVHELNNGAAQPNISVTSLHKYPLLMPPEGVLNQFAVHIGGHWKLADTLRAQISVLAAQRELLLPRLLSGQVEVAAA